MTWLIVSQCNDCACISEPRAICNDCGATEFNLGIGRKFGPIHWEVIPERFSQPIKDHAQVLHVDSKGNQLIPSDLVISNNTYTLVSQKPVQPLQSQPV